jgi:release factor glutamine methyltransferase
LFLLLVTFGFMMHAPTSKDLFRQLATSLSGLYSEPESRSIAFALLEYRLGLRNTEVLAGKALPEGQEVAMADLDKDIERLRAGEPLQYVLGEAEFWGLPFIVTPHVLIPRPETEELVALILKERTDSGSGRILDICTGSGCIAITLQHQLKKAAVWGLDISKEALAIAQQNAARHAAPVQFIEADVLRVNAAELPGSLDVIVSNPPYVTEAEKALMKDNVLLHEPHLALFVSNNEPLIFYAAIARLSQQLLKKGGNIYFEINEQFGAEVAELLKEMHYTDIYLYKDMSGKDRIVRGVWPA